MPHFQPATIRTFGVEFRHMWGSLWPFISQDIREALVDAKVLAIVAGLDRDHVPMTLIDELRQQMHLELPSDCK